MSIILHSFVFVTVINKCNDNCVLAFITQLPSESSIRGVDGVERGSSMAIIAMSSRRDSYYQNNNFIPPWQQDGDDFDDVTGLRGNYYPPPRLYSFGEPSFQTSINGRDNNYYFNARRDTNMQSQWSQQEPQQSSYEYRAQPEMYDMNYYDGASSQSTIRFGMGTSEDFREGSSSTSQKRRFYDKENVGSSFNNNNINPRQQQRPQWGGMQNDYYYGRQSGSSSRFDSRSGRGWGNIDNDDYSYAPKNNNRPYYPSSQQQQRRGSNIGEKYTENFRDGTRKRREQQTPPRWQTSYPLYGSNDRDMYDSEQFGFFDNNVKDELQSSPRISWDERRRRVQQEQQQQQNRDNFGNFESNTIGNNRSYERRESIYNEPLPPPPPPPRPPPMEPFDVDEDDIMMGSMRRQQQFGSDTRQPGRRYEGRNEEPDQPRFTRPMQQQQYQSPNDRGFIQGEYETEDMSERPQQQPSNNMRPTRQQYPQSGTAKQYGPGNSFEPRTGYRSGQPRRRRGPLQPRRQSYQQKFNIPSPRLSNNGYLMQDDPSMGFSYGGIRRMFDRLINPYAAFGQMNRMMERVNVDMQRSMVQDQQSMKALLSDASDFLLNDVALRNVLGTNIELGTPFSKTSSSTMVNGITKSRLELIIPVSGTQNTGRVRLVANQDGITQLELDVGGRIINVPLDKRRWDEDVMDADVVDREVYYDD